MKNSLVFAKLWKFFLAQTLYQTIIVALMRVGISVGEDLSMSANLPHWVSSIPLSLVVLGTLVLLFPASFWLKRFGSRTMYTISSFIGILGGFGLIAGVLSTSLVLFSVGMLFVGFFQAIIQYLRFSAMDQLEGSDKLQALSGILIAGIPAAIFGPLLGQIGKNLIPDHTWAGSFVILTGLMFIILFLTLSFQKQSAQVASQSESGPRRTPGEFLAKNPIWTASIASSFAFGLMVLIMAASSPAMKHSHHEETLATIVLTAHVLAMYIPSFFSGAIVKKIGPSNMIILGLAVMGIESIVALTGTEFPSFLASLILLGLGWNFMFVGGNSLLVTIYKPSEKAFVQGFHDTLVFALGSIGIFWAAGLENSLGWINLNLLPLPAIVLVGLFVVFYKRGASKLSK